MPRDFDVTGQRHFRISDERLEMTSGDLSASYQWSAIETVFRRKGLVIFWTTPGVGFFIPERDLANPADFLGFVEERVLAERQRPGYSISRYWRGPPPSRG